MHSQRASMHFYDSIAVFERGTTTKKIALLSLSAGQAGSSLRAVWN